MTTFRSKLLLSAGVGLLALLLAGVFVRRPDSPSPPGVTAMHAGVSAEIPGSGAVPDMRASMETWNEKIQFADASGLKALLVAAFAISDPELRHDVVTEITSRWMKIDARGFLGYLTALEVRGEGKALAVLTDALRDSLTQLTPGQAGTDDIRLIVQRLVSIVVATDPEGALQWARLWLVGDTLETALVSISRSFARTDVPRGLQLMDSIQSPLRRNQAYAMLGGIWASHDAVAAYEWAAGLQDRTVRAMSLNSVLLALAQTEPDLAASELRAQAERINSEYRRERDAELAAKGLTQADLVEDRATYVEMINSGAIPPPMSPDVELMAIASKVVGEKLAASDPSAALAWADSLEGDYLRLMTISGVLEGWSRENPVKAAEYLAANYPSSVDLAKALYGSWAAVDAKAAAEGSRMIVDAGQRDAVLADVVKIWSVKGDASQAIRYVESLPVAQNTDAVKYSLSTAISQGSPVEAWAIASGISDQSAQYRALKSALSVLVAQNPEQAANLLKSTSLSSSVSQRLAGVLEAVGVKG